MRKKSSREDCQYDFWIESSRKGVPLRAVVEKQNCGVIAGDLEASDMSLFFLFASAAASSILADETIPRFQNHARTSIRLWSLLC